MTTDQEPTPDTTSEDTYRAERKRERDAEEAQVARAAEALHTIARGFRMRGASVDTSAHNLIAEGFDTLGTLIDEKLLHMKKWNNP